MGEWTEERHAAAKARCEEVRPWITMDGLTAPNCRAESVIATFNRFACGDLPDALTEIERHRARLEREAPANVHGFHVWPNTTDS